MVLFLVLVLLLLLPPLLLSEGAPEALGISKERFLVVIVRFWELGFGIGREMGLQHLWPPHWYVILVLLLLLLLLLKLELITALATVMMVLAPTRQAQGTSRL